MSDRIPPSLSWLVKRRRSVAGLISVAEKRREQFIQDHEKQLKDFIRQSDIELRALQVNLSALDRTICQHEIPIDTTKLGATRVQQTQRHASYGAMTRSIRAALALAHPRALTTDSVTAFVCTHCQLTPSEQEYVHIRYRVRIRLKCLVAEGKALRLHTTLGNKIGMWRDIASDLPQVDLNAKARREDSEQLPAKIPCASFQEIMERYRER